MATAPPLGMAASFAILGGTTVTNTGPSNINGDVGVSPGSAITGFPPGVVTGGALHPDDALATQAQADLATAYGIVAGEVPTTTFASTSLTGLTLTPGVDHFTAAAQLDGTLTFDAQGDPNAVFVVQIVSALTTQPNSNIVLINGAHASNVFWQVGSSATIGSGTTFQGNILALTSITLVGNTSIAPGRALAINGAVTMDTNNASTTQQLIITANDQSGVYGTTPATPTLSYSGFVNGDTPASLTTQPAVTNAATSASHVGSYSLTASGAADPDYTISYVAGTDTVTAAPLTISANDQTKVYGAALPPLTAGYSGFVNGDTAASLETQPTLATTATAASHVGSYSLTASGAADSDYSISYVAGTLDVTAAPLIITANDQSGVYGTTPATPTLSYSGFVNGDTPASLTTQPAVTNAATSASHVGSYSLTASGAADPDYTISYVAGTDTVTAAPLTISANDQTKVYGAALPPLTAGYSGFVNGDTAASLETQPTLATTATAASHVGSYSLTASGAADSDYSISYVAGTLDVTAAPLIITANDQSGVYGTTLPPLTAGYSGFVNGDTAASLETQPTLATTATAASHVGSYSITASGAADSDYSISYVAGTLDVTAAPLIITANDQSGVYGTTPATPTLSYSGFVNGDTPASLTTQPAVTNAATSASHVGSYSLTASGAADPDYTISYVAGTDTVTAAPLTISANDQTKVYGAALPPLTAGYSGFVNGDTAASLETQPTLATTATSASHVGSYSLTASGAADPDYTISYVAGTDTVTAAPLTISANDQTKVYGAALPPLTASYSGFVNGDTAASLETQPTLATTATAASHVSGNPYAITASGAADGDYLISYSPGTLIVTPAPLTISANDQSKVYGAALPPLTASYSGFVNGDTAAIFSEAGNTPPTLSTTATASSSVAGSPYPISAGGAANPDYSIGYAAGQLNVTPTSAVPGVISGTVYLDLNASGLPDAGEPGLAGRVVFLDINHDGRLDAGDPTATTDSSGNFSLINSGTGPVSVLEATELDASSRYVIDQTATNADGSVTIGVVPISPVAPVPVVPNPFSSNPSTDANAAYVQSLYRAVLKRVGADSEVAAWVSELDSGTTRQAVAARFINSPEHREDQVYTYYEEFLHRAPDPTSADWINDLLSGVSEETVVEGFLDSPEYQSAHQDPSLFVNDLYIDVLGRHGEAADLTAWQATLAAGTSPEAIVARFVNSTEAIDQLVDSFYTSYLHRQPEQGTSAPWFNMLKQPDGSASDVASGILASGEYQRDAVNPQS